MPLPELAAAVGPGGSFSRLRKHNAAEGLIYRLEEPRPT